MKKQEHSLIDKDEILLERYHDGECGIWARLRAERLISKSSSALAFLERLQRLAVEKREYVSATRPEKVDLWSNIERRIDEEERAEFYLGRRSKGSTSESGRPWSIDWVKAGWGLSGAFVTAAFGIVLFRVASVQPVNGVADGTNQNRAGVVASLGSNQPSGILQTQPVKLQEFPLVLGREGNLVRRPVEVDWMRSDGRVHIIQDPDDRSAIIWVKKRRSRILNDELFSMDEEDRNPDRPKIINKRIPESVSVSDVK